MTSSGISIRFMSVFCVSFILILIINCRNPVRENNSPPECTILQPLNGSVIGMGDQLTVTVSASDPDGYIDFVRVFVDDNEAIVLSDTPYVFIFNTTQQDAPGITLDFGPHTIRAMAVDDDGSGTSDYIDIEIDYVYQIPQEVDDAWETASVIDAGLNQDLLTDLIRKIYREDLFYMRSILIVQDGKLVFEEYFHGLTRTTLHHTQSVTKSITSLVFGIAKDQGYVGELSDSVYNYFPEFAHYRTEEKDRINLQHVLTMTPGLHWNEVSTDVVASENDNVIGHTLNYIMFVLSKSLAYEPGTRWYYNSGCPILLGGIIRNTTNRQPAAFAAEHLFGPLGIIHYQWPGLPLTNNLTGTHGSLFLTSRGMAKIGQLMLNWGMWKGQRIVSDEWVAESIVGHAFVGGTTRYGFLWWVRDRGGYHSFYADGFGGQQIVVIPEIDMVVVTAAEYDHILEDTSLHGPQRQEVWNLIENYCIRSF